MVETMYSQTIKGALKILLGIVIKLTGWALSETLQSDLIEGLSLLIGIVLDLWGVSQVYRGRQALGGIDWRGRRVTDQTTSGSK